MTTTTKAQAAIAVLQRMGFKYVPPAEVDQILNAATALDWGLVDELP